jgi:D-xylose transport system permease protein
MSTDATAAAPEFEPQGVLARARDNIRGGTLGSWPVLIGLAVIVVFFSFKADNFLSPGNFSNIITQMAGTTLLAYGVVFVLLIGEIDLSISYISGIAGVVVGKLTIPDGSFEIHGVTAILLAVAACVLIGAFQGSFVAYIGVPAFVVTLAGYQIWQGVIQKSIEAEGVIVIQDTTVNNTANYFFSERAGWILAAIVIGIYIATVVSTFVSHRRHGVPVRDPWLLVAKAVVVAAATVFVVVVSNRDRGVPFVLVLMIAALLVLTFVAKRTTFGRHVYAVGGNAEAARRAGINVARVRVIVFMISGAMAGLGGVVLAARLNSVDLNAGGGTLLIDAIAAAVIGGTSLFGGRGEVKNALFGALVIATIANGLNTLNLTQGVIFITTGCILLFAVTLDTILRRRQRAAGR